MTHHKPSFSFVAFAITAILLAIPALAGAQSPTFTTLDDIADPTFNQLLGINDSGVISGYFGSGAAGHPNTAYTLAPPYAQSNYSLATLPSSTQSQATGINDMGTVVGFWSPTNTGTDANYGFIRQTNRFTFLSVNNPSAASTPLVNQLLGINNNNIAVGFYLDASGNSHGYAYTVKTGTFTPIAIEGQQSSTATGINKDDLVCGFYTTGGVTYGFTQSLQNGLTWIFGVAGSTNTQLLGINNAGDAVGSYVDSGGVIHGLLVNVHSGAFHTIDSPNGVGGTVLNGINNKNEAVGFYVDAAGNTDGLLVMNLP